MEQSANVGELGSAAGCWSGGAPRNAQAGRICRGVVRLLLSLDYRALIEFSLPDGRRADVAALDAHGVIAIVEVKSSVADFRADAKWPGYRGFCDAFFFAVGPDFPQALLPPDAGLIVADGFAGAMVRPAPIVALNGARRRALLLRFARTAASRLTILADAAASQPGTGW
jgi:hypothetical protein